MGIAKCLSGLPAIAASVVAVLAVRDLPKVFPAIVEPVAIDVIDVKRVPPCNELPDNAMRQKLLVLHASCKVPPRLDFSESQSVCV